MGKAKKSSARSITRQRVRARRGAEKALRAYREGQNQPKPDRNIANRYFLAVPRLVYSAEFDPEPDTIAIARNSQHGTRLVHVPEVTIEWPAVALVDGKARRDFQALPQRWAQWVLDATFAMPYARIPTVEYLFALAQNLAGHPLLERFDTAIRDGLGAIEEEAIYRAFWLLSDYLQGDHDEQWLWAHLATYVFWAECTSVGIGLPYCFARLDDCEKKTGKKEHAALIAQIREATYPERKR